MVPFEENEQGSSSLSRRQELEQHTMVRKAIWIKKAMTKFPVTDLVFLEFTVKSAYTGKSCILSERANKEL